MFSVRPGSGNVKDNFPNYPQLPHKEIVAFIEQHSVAVRYWKAITCPCTSPDTGQPDPRCNYCRGLGWFHSSVETEEKYLRAQVHSRNSRKETGKGGVHTTGGATITFLPGVIPGDGDLVQVCADVDLVNNETHVAGSRLVDGTTAERLRYRDVLCVEKVVASGSPNTSPFEVSGWSYDDTQHRIILPASIPEGTKYTVRYMARPEFILIGETMRPMLRVAHDEGMPADVRFKTDIVYPFMIDAIRLDRALSQRLRGNIDRTTPSTYNTGVPFR